MTRRNEVAPLDLTPRLTAIGGSTPLEGSLIRRGEDKPVVTQACRGAATDRRDQLILMGLRFVQMQVDAQARKFREASERTDQHQREPAEGDRA